MKKLRIITLLLGVVIIIFCGIKLSQSYSSLSTIYYNGDTKQITLFNTNNTDLFTNFKEMMPGDVKEQEVLFKLENIRRDTKLFLKIDKNIDDEILKFVNIGIYVDNNKLINNGEYIELGNFSKDGEITLKTVIEIPKEVGSQIEGVQQNTIWNILIQEQNGELIEVPQTYDNSNILLYFIIIIICLIIMIYSGAILIRSNGKNTRRKTYRIRKN